MSFTQSLLHSVFNNTGSPRNVKSSWHLASSLGNHISDSFKSIILCIGRSSIRSPLFRVFPINNLTLLTKPSASEFMPTTFAIGHWLRLASVFSRTISPFWKFLFYVPFVMRLKRPQKFLSPSNPEFIGYMLYTSPSFSTVFISLHKVTRWWQTTLDFMVRMLLGHIGCSLCTSPNVSTVKGLEFTIASVSARSVLSDSSFRDLLCVCNKDIGMVHADRICLSQTPPIWLDAWGFLCQLM